MFGVCQGIIPKKNKKTVECADCYQFMVDKHHNKIKNYKIISEIRVELAKKMKIQQSQSILAKAWKPYINNTDSVLEDATCYETSMRYPTDVKLLWEANEWIYTQIQKINKILKGRMPRSKYLEQKEKYLKYSKSRKRTFKQTRKRIKSLLYLLEKLLSQLSEIQSKIEINHYFPKKYFERVSTIKKIYEQQSLLFEGEKVSA